MGKESPEQHYQAQVEYYREAVANSSRRINAISLLRLAAGAGIIWMIVLAIRQQQSAYYATAIASTALFLFLVGLFNKHKEQRALLHEKRKLNEEELACLRHEFSRQADGHEFADKTHAWSHDLDLFGQGSLFQYLNRTSLLMGKSLLAQWLCTAPDHPEIVRKRQAQVAEMRDRTDFRQDFTARGRLMKETPGALPGILQWLSSSSYIAKHRWLRLLAVLMSILSLSTLLAGIIDSSYFRLFIPILVFNFSILSPFLNRTNRYQADISRKHELLKGYAGLLHILAGETFAEPGLRKRQAKASEGMKELRKLSRLLNLFDQRLNFFMVIILNGLFLFDFHMLFLLERWKQRNRANTGEWIEACAQTDVLVSLSGFAFNHPAFCLPQFEEKDQILEMTGLGHPLIPPSKRIVNDLALDEEKVIIITGANMAGKSTFLRALGINMVLAYTGCPVCAGSFRLTYSSMCSSMRTADSLKDEESYFLAEIRRLQRIVQKMEEGKPLLILLDEVLKGTNTTDKKKGSVGIIRKALKYPVICFIATHDLSLGEMEKLHEGKIRNCCFESYIEDMELSFDYKIRPGLATNMNASHLMKQMGIMD